MVTFLLGSVPERNPCSQQLIHMTTMWTTINSFTSKLELPEPKVVAVDDHMLHSTEKAWNKVPE
jgi:hypothetical protein